MGAGQVDSSQRSSLLPADSVIRGPMELPACAGWPAASTVAPPTTSAERMTCRRDISVITELLRVGRSWQGVEDSGSEPGTYVAKNKVVVPAFRVGEHLDTVYPGCVHSVCGDPKDGQ